MYFRLDFNLPIFKLKILSFSSDFFQTSLGEKTPLISKGSGTEILSSQVLECALLLKRNAPS